MHAIACVELIEGVIQCISGRKLKERTRMQSSGEIWQGFIFNKKQGSTGEQKAPQTRDGSEKALTKLRSYLLQKGKRPTKNHSYEELEHNNEITRG